MLCSICKETTLSYTHPDFPHAYTYCPSCEMVLLLETFYVDVTREKKQYDFHNNSLENSGYVRMFEDFLDFFWKELTCKAPTVLDFGSGPTPVLAHLMQKRGANVMCYDKFYQQDTAYKSHSFDLITSTEVFEHLDTPKQTLQHLSERLNPQGILAIMTLFHTNSEDFFWKWWYRRDPTHIVFYTPKTFEILAPLCGLKIIKSDDTRIIVLQKG